MKVESTEKFISKFAQYKGLSGYPNLKSLPKILRDLLYIEYPKWDGTFDIIVKSDTEPNDISFTYEKDKLWIWQQNGILHTAVERPYWSRGLRKHIKDEILYDPISWFFHLSAQYYREK